MKRYFWPVAMCAIAVLLIAGCSKKEEVDTAASEAGEATAEDAGALEGDTGMEASAADIPSLDLRRVHFEFDSATLTSEAKSILRNNADLLSGSSGVSVVIEGHCDERGSVEYNLALGQRRADSIKNYLSQLGVSPDRVSTLSYGEERPLMDGSSEVAWAKNRRGEFVVNP